ncbi:MAG: nuclear transport factor 2 family protein, partial [Rhodanobacteraceae bacterium]
MNTEQIAKRLVELCRKGEYEQAQRELYAQDAVSIEMPGSPAGALGDAKGLE